MPYLVNQQLITEEVIRQEEQRIGRDPRWRQIRDESQRALRLRAAAEQSAIDRTLVEQEARRDPRPIDPQELNRAVAEIKRRSGCREAFDDTALRRQTEFELRMQRTLKDLVAGAAPVNEEEVRRFYEVQRHNFRSPDTFEASHILKKVERGRSEQQAYEGIKLALAELERGDPFPEVVDRHSDCLENRGNLGRFPAGEMVPDFEAVLRSLQPGQRSHIFRTGFGYHIAELHAAHPGQAAQFDDVSRDIRDVMKMGNEHQEYQRQVAALRARADIRPICREDAAIVSSLKPPPSKG